MSASPDYTKFPLALLLLVVLGYVLVGWYLSAYPWLWSAYASFLAAILIVFVVGAPLACCDRARATLEISLVA